MNKSETISKLAAALLKAQRAIEHAKKSSKNPFFKSNYADLTEVIETIKTPLNDNGITFLQIVDQDGEGKAVIETTLLHESGEYISGRTPVFCAKPNDPQALGSGITYSKRYGLQAICGLATEDDDGEAAMGRSGNKRQTRTSNVAPKSLLTSLDELKLLCDQLGKSAEDKAKMIRYVGEDDTIVGFEDLSKQQISKLVGVLKKQSK